MSVKIIDNTAKITIDTKRKASIALRYIGDDILSRSRPLTPKDKGNLRNDTLVQILGLRGTVKWVKKYAAIQERGVIKGTPIRNYTTPGTGKKFAERGVKAAVDNARTQFKKAGLV